MNNLKQVTHQTIAQVRSFPSRKIGLLLALIIGFAVLGSSRGQLTAVADSRNPSVIFTKWVTTAGTAPVLYNMAGIVSGDVGGGQFVGEVLSLTDTAGTTNIVALYHLNGGVHQFTARLNVAMSDATGDAVIKGKVTDGWMKGAKVRGAYQTIAPCGILNAQNGAFGDACFQGTLELERGD